MATISEKVEDELVKHEPPAIITVNQNKEASTNKPEGDDVSITKTEDKKEAVAFRQAKTPKHANKTASLEKGTEGDKAGFGVEEQLQQLQQPSFPPQQQRPLMNAQYEGYYQGQQQQSGYRYDGPPHQGGSYYSGVRDQTLVTVSPGGTYYAAPGRAGEDYRQQQQGYRFGPQRDYRYDGYQQQYGSGYPPDASYGRGGYPDQRYAQQYPGAGRGPLPPPQYYNATSMTHEPVSRAVSSSFDRSINKSNPDGAPFPQAQEGDNNSVAAPSDDSSWRQLQQVTSIDEAAMKERLEQRKREKQIKAAKGEETGSTSSSLTNSPSDDKPTETTAKPATGPTPSKLAALDSLSSVASREEPIATNDDKPTAGGPPSPGSSSGSLDLMKCHSGSSGLLHGFPHQRDPSMGSFHIPMEYRMDNSKPEDRGDANTNAREGDEARSSAPTADGAKEQSSKRKSGEVALDGEKGKKKAKDDDGKSREIACSPSAAARQTRSNSVSSSPAQSLQASYSMDSNLPPLPNASSKVSYPLARPNSSSSSTITPMEQNRDIVGGMPSWDILPQDSFGTGLQMMSTLSFTQDYPGLTASGSSNLGGSNLGLPGAAPPPPQPTSRGPPPAVTESRNQSFEGYGNFGRTDSYGSAGGAPPPSRSGPPGPTPYPPHGKYKQPQYPPHAPSWGTTQSTGGPYAGPPPSYSQYRAQGAPGSPSRAPYAAVSRTYSDDRGSPTPAAGGPMTRGGVLAPAEFVAPHNVLQRQPPPAVYIMSTTQKGEAIKKRLATGSGVYSWTKDDDNRLTEVMKKQKNPRDWEPIAEEHGRGKSAKECHERWIRYLKPGVRKGQWQDHEDAIVVEAVTTSKEQPFTRWSDLAQRLPGRVGKQIRDRWVNHLNPAINHLPFSREDDLLLWEGQQQLGKRWVEIATKFFKQTRSENHIKNRWYSASFKKFIANEFGPDAYARGSAGESVQKSKKNAKV